MGVFKFLQVNEDDEWRWYKDKVKDDFCTHSVKFPRKISGLRRLRRFCLLYYSWLCLSRICWRQEQVNVSQKNTGYTERDTCDMCDVTCVLRDMVWRNVTCLQWWVRGVWLTPFGSIEWTFHFIWNLKWTVGGDHIILLNSIWDGKLFQKTQYCQET